jgi:MFS family permease
MGLAVTVLSAVFLATGGFLFGYDSGIITSTIALPTFNAYFNRPSDTITGGIVSAFQGGAILGTIINMLFADMLGRRWTIMIGALISVFGSSLQAGAVNMTMLIVGRFIGGVAVANLPRPFLCMLESSLKRSIAAFSPVFCSGCSVGAFWSFSGWGMAAPLTTHSSPVSYPRFQPHTLFD